jgi:hypothetical protein
VSKWKVTVRHGSDVGREKFGTLEEAIEDARGRVDEFRRQDRLPSIHFIRHFTPEQRVAARIEISGPGLFRAPEGGIDVLGDGSAIAYTGAVRKEPIEADTVDEAFERLREALGD